MNATALYVFPAPFRAAGALSYPETRISQARQSSFAPGAAEDKPKFIRAADIRQGFVGANHRSKQAKLIQDGVLHQLLRSTQASKQASLYRR